MQLDPVKDEQLSLDGTAITEDGKLFLLQLKNEYKSAIWDTDSGRLVHRFRWWQPGEKLDGCDIIEEHASGDKPVQWLWAPSV